MAKKARVKAKAKAKRTRRTRRSQLATGEDAMIVSEINGVPVVTDTVIYKVTPGSKVLFSSKPGDFEGGATSFSWDGEERQGNPHFSREPINKGGKPIQNTVMHVVTIAFDASPTTDRTSVEYVLEGGVSRQRFPYAVQALQNFGLTRYHITFVFN